LFIESNRKVLTFKKLSFHLGHQASDATCAAARHHLHYLAGFLELLEEAVDD
jgi:hypothetical protein